MNLQRRVLTALALAAVYCFAVVPPGTCQAATGHAESGPLESTASVARAAARQVLESTGATSLSLAVVDGRHTVWSSTIGQLDESGSRPGATTLYGIGSVSKMLATTAVMQLVDGGVVSLDAPVTDYVTDFRMASPEYRQITVRMLLDHSAGLPGTAYSNVFTTTPYAGYAQQVLDTLAESRLKTTPGAMSVYCNDCFTLAGILVERMSGLTYPAYVQQRILAPLGMRLSRYATSAPEPGSVARVVVDEANLPIELASIYASGGLMSTPTEMGRLAAMYLNGGTLDGVRILSPSAVAEMGRSQVPSTLSPTKPPLLAYGLGWDSVAEPGLAAAGVEGWVKGGDTGQYHAAFTLAPEHDLAVVVLAAGVTVDSGTLETLAQRVMLAALAEKGVIDGLPEPQTTTGPPTARPEAHQLVDISGIYLAQGASFRVSTRPDGSVRLAVRMGAEWVESPDPLTMRTDGRFWSAAEPTKAIGLTRGWGRTYLVLTRAGGVGHYREEIVLGQKATSVDPLSPAWRQRLAGTWLNVTERPDSLLWQVLPGLTLEEIPGLGGYLWVTDALAPAPVDPRSSDQVATMFLTVPIAQGRDLSDLVVVPRGGAEWLRFGGALYQPVSTIPELAVGTANAIIGSQGLAEWRSIPAAGTLRVAGAGRWRLFGPDGTSLANGSARDDAIDAPTGSFLVLFGDPGCELALSLG